MRRGEPFHRTATPSVRLHCRSARTSFQTCLRAHLPKRSKKLMRRALAARGLSKMYIRTSFGTYCVTATSIVKETP
jgi:hypothetical protein